MTARNFTGTVFDHFNHLARVVGEPTLRHPLRWPFLRRGSSHFVIAPCTNSGSFFAGQNRSASRSNGASNYSFALIERLGTHQLKVGGYLA